jgi:uncharacterized protein
MTGTLEEREKALAKTLASLDSCIIAYSGGLDSVFLAVMASRHVAGRVLCVTVADASTPARDLQSAKETAEAHKLEHLVINARIHPDTRRNSKDRCYSCKSELFRRLDSIRAAEGLEAVLDGENASDCKDDRPGSRAARERGVLSPLANAGLAKDDIRILARKLGIGEWDRPASACLSSRVPFGTSIDDAVLKKIDRTEDYIRSKGIRMVRARAEGNGTRLELGQDENTEKNRLALRAAETEIKAFGWEHVEIDPQGYVPAGLRKKNGR